MQNVYFPSTVISIKHILINAMTQYKFLFMGSKTGVLSCGKEKRIDNVRDSHIKIHTKRSKTQWCKGLTCFDLIEEWSTSLIQKFVYGINCTLSGSSSALLMKYRFLVSEHNSSIHKFSFSNYKSTCIIDTQQSSLVESFAIKYTAPAHIRNH